MKRRCLVSADAWFLRCVVPTMLGSYLMLGSYPVIPVEIFILSELCALHPSPNSVPSVISV